MSPIRSSADLHHSTQVGTLSLKIVVPHLWQSAFSSSLHISTRTPQLWHFRSMGVGDAFRMLPGHFTLLLILCILLRACCWETLYGCDPWCVFKQLQGYSLA